MTTKGTLKHKIEDVSIPDVIYSGAWYPNSSLGVKFAEDDTWHTFKDDQWEFVPDAPSLVETIQALKNGAQFRYVSPTNITYAEIYTKLDHTQIVRQRTTMPATPFVTTIDQEFKGARGSIEVIE